MQLKSHSYQGDIHCWADLKKMIYMYFSKYQSVVNMPLIKVIFRVVIIHGGFDPIVCLHKRLVKVQILWYIHGEFLFSIFSFLIFWEGTQTYALSPPNRNVYRL